MPHLPRDGRNLLRPRASEDEQLSAASASYIVLMNRTHLFYPFAAYVKSNTVVGDSKHSTGVVMAEIVKANIPVRNGVVHLIHRPLMVVDTTVFEFLEVS